MIPDRIENKSQNVATQIKIQKEKKIRKQILKKKPLESNSIQASKPSIPPKKTGSTKTGLLPPIIKQQSNI
jgi:hypothetical protein